MTILTHNMNGFERVVFFFGMRCYVSLSTCYDVLVLKTFSGRCSSTVVLRREFLLEGTSEV